MESDFSYLIREKAMLQIIVEATKAVIGIKKVSCRKLLAKNGLIFIHLGLVAQDGINLQELAENVQDEVAKRLQAMINLNEFKIDITIEDIIS